MSAVKLAPRARDDLVRIWRYTAERWSQAQADSYLRLINQEIVKIGSDPRLARECDDIRPGYRRRAAQSHVLYFKVAKDGIEIMRVLHKSMDAKRHL